MMTMVSLSLWGAVGEEACRVHSTATRSSNQTGSRQKDWREASCLAMGLACCLDMGLGDYAGPLGGKTASPARRCPPKTCSGADASWWAVSWGKEI